MRYFVSYYTVLIDLHAFFTQLFKPIQINSNQHVPHIINVYREILGSPISFITVMYFVKNKQQWRSENRLECSGLMPRGVEQGYLCVLCSQESYIESLVIHS